jgi:Holliday junction resolvase
MSNFGHARERQIKKLLEAEGWFVIRAPASLGVADLVALKAGETPRMIEAKANEQGGPYMNFRPPDRTALIEAAEAAGAKAELAFWPKRGELIWIDSSVWPVRW